MIGVLKKAVEDIEHKLLDCRREALVGYKLMGDLIDAEVLLPERAIDMITAIVKSAKRISVFDDAPEIFSSPNNIQFFDTDIVSYQDFCRVLVLISAFGQRLLNHNQK